jgi:ribose-phosphate pyrophosphokinase
MTTIIFDFPKPTALGQSLRKLMGVEEGIVVTRSFPDGETYLRVETDVEGHEVIVNASLYQPNDWLLNLMFLADTLVKQGAKRVVLLAPYLSYMRQDKVFHSGEAITSATFAQLISGYFDHLVTVDPHLHRYKSLDEIYTIPATVVHSASLLDDWIKLNVKDPFIIGPDEESLQWVREVAGDYPYTVLSKVRHADGHVVITWPEIEQMGKKTPVLVDDIISSGGTMIQAIQHLKALGYKDPLCITIHPIFAENSYHIIQELGVVDVISCNSIAHPSNKIDLAPLLAQALSTILLGK